MKNLKKLIKLEASVHLPVPFMELLFAFIVAISMFAFGGSFQSLPFFDIQSLYSQGITTLYNN